MNSIQIVYPSDLLHATMPDENFAQEYQQAQQSGIHCLLLSSEAAALGKYRFSTKFNADIPVIWRGWMMDKDEYQQLHEAVDKQGVHLLTSVDAYLNCHHLVGWYSLCQNFTPKTVIVSADADFDTLVKQLQWPAYFVKDYVKSLTTTRGSVAHDAKEIQEVINLLKQYRGQIEGGICLRHFEHFDQQSERRYFVLKGQVYSSDNHIPMLVTEIAKRIESPFFTIDMVINDAGELRLIEIGDGQVSDIKEWSVERFVQILNSL
ncbi:ATP-grasp domain-containing protein [Budviciaceae bacterium CWB-B4]|uniref:ATP-grasp domain-containing protein n=1 Tax=Limnobaculum xujianqingii TaxID=2738837 RepID=A0A9D7AHV9_9GAMM|nr:ATP-grasp domain-containing protein [Limnobaculum xujianqingii]MBK5072993.1 ATP-grasp domain-containing protein [Limnobaculum xujianqingii]MBK5176302.1 ATP-grasp domain-containing protein [Limnobaculum xujianqingii]